MRLTSLFLLLPLCACASDPFGLSAEVIADGGGDAGDSDNPESGSDSPITSEGSFTPESGSDSGAQGESSTPDDSALTDDASEANAPDAAACCFQCNLQITKCAISCMQNDGGQSCQLACQQTWNTCNTGCGGNCTEPL